MFTGIIQATGTISAIDETARGARIVVDPGGWAHHPSVGDSIALDGCCLTLAEPASPRLAFDAVPETLSKTTLGRLQHGRPVHLEHAATPTTLLGGHILQGHVDGVARVTRVQRGDDHRIRVAPPEALMQFVAPKGSVGVAGVSLTVASLDPDEGWFEVALIPTTLERTTLGGLVEGDEVNFEADMLNKMAVHWLKHFAH